MFPAPFKKTLLSRLFLLFLQRIAVLKVFSPVGTRWIEIGKGYKYNRNQELMLEDLTLNVTLDAPPTRAGTQVKASSDVFIQEVLKDYEICMLSREVSLVARREVMTGKAKFGVTGDGKEVPQVAMARAFRKGDWRSGYYRDQTLMFALGLCTAEDFFAQLYADAANDPFSGGRQMNNHYATPIIDKQTGEWTRHRDSYNISSDISCTAGQMGRALGLALASKKYRESPELRQSTTFSNGGNEVCFCTIGDASTSEGPFWETINAAGVRKVPLAISVWDDGYGISVPTALQTTKGSVSEALQGFKLDEDGRGIDIYVCPGWDYPQLCALYETAIDKIRKTHIPALFHITDLTQPQGHSTSGSHERYKSKERLEWEKENDCVALMRKWILDSGISTQDELAEIDARIKTEVKGARRRAWSNYFDPIKQSVLELDSLFDELALAHPDKAAYIEQQKKEIHSRKEPFSSELIKAARQTVLSLKGKQSEAMSLLQDWVQQALLKGAKDYNTHLHSTSSKAALNIAVVPAIYTETSPVKNAYEIINAFFDVAFEKNPTVFAFGEDVGFIGDVNQGFAGLQEKYGEERVFDDGIREWTIVGEAIGLALRGLRPIAEIQYIDYFLYGLTPLSDDLASLRYRSNGVQQAPVIIRTRGHRLEGIWHSGSPMGMMVHALRGIYLCVPRNLTQAAGMYATLLQSDDPGIVVECLNGYRLKERLPDNIGSYTVPLGVPQVLVQGDALTVVTYGSCVRVAEEALELLKEHGHSIELIDVQTLLPFDLEHVIVASLKKTNRILFLDEDVPGGATAYMMQEVLEKQGGYRYLDAAPVTITAKAHRTPYGSDGDYFTKPNAEELMEAILEMLTV